MGAGSCPKVIEVSVATLSVRVRARGRPVGYTAGEGDAGEGEDGPARAARAAEFAQLAESFAGRRAQVRGVMDKVRARFCLQEGSGLIVCGSSMRSRVR